MTFPPADWTFRAEPFPERSALASFDDVAARTPDAVALIVGTAEYTYRTLASRARIVGRKLVELGVGPGDFVGICLDREFDLVAAMLAVSTAGAAYVPLDPRMPPMRQSTMLADAGAKYVLTKRANLGSLASELHRCVILDEIDLGGYPDDPVPQRFSLDDPAYVIFTSGSTGRPKGVVISQRSLSSLVAWAGTFLDDDDRTGVLAASSAAFDVSVFEIYAALCFGGRLIMVPDVLALHAAPRREDVRVLCSSAAALAEVLATGPLPAGIRVIMQAGEKLRASVAERALAYPQARVYNLCGATEDTVYSMVQRVTSAQSDPTVGRPMPNRAIYVLDEALQPVPVGVPGEVYYGGVGVARGYVGRPELTAERFVFNPFGHSATMYRSGDLMRWTTDGELEVLGRIDGQLKVRGMRLETDELEGLLLAHPAVANCAVGTRGEDEKRHLAAYFQPRPGFAPSAEELRAFLGQHLPPNLLPTRYLRVDDFPLSISGKVDRRALAEIAIPATHGAAPTEASSPGASNLEIRLQRLFAEVLDVPSVGLDENFFTIGGQSVLAGRLFARIEAEFPGAAQCFRDANGESRFYTVFYHQSTARKLAAAMEGERQQASQIVRLHEGAAGVAPMFWNHGMINGDGVYAWEMLGQLPADVPFYVVHPHGYDNMPFADDLAKMADDHYALIKRIRPHGPYRLGGFCNGALTMYEIARRLRAEGEEIDVLLLVGIPSLHPAGEAVVAIADRLVRALRIGRRGERLIFRGVRGIARHAQEMLRVALDHGPAALRRAAAQLLRNYRRSAETADNATAEIGAFVDHSFKHVQYLRAIAGHRVLPYDGEATLVYGASVYPRLESEAGWKRYLRRFDLHVVPGGHFTVPESATPVGKILATMLGRRG